MPFKYHKIKDVPIMNALPLHSGDVIDWAFMETFLAARFQNAIVAIRHMTEEAHQSEPKEWFIGNLALVETECERLHCGAAKKQAKRVREDFEAFKSAGLLEPIREIERRLRDELENVHFVHVAFRDLIYLDGAKEFGEDVFVTFPDARQDVIEAGHALAVGLPTACVMHLMRALEVPLKLFFKELNLPEVKGGWGPSVTEIQRQLTAFTSGPQASRPSNWEKKKEFYHELATNFNHLREAWRNNAMHASVRYSESDARKIWDHVKHHMQAWSKKP